MFSEEPYEAPLDYSRTRGLIGEIMMELKQLDEKKELLADASKQPEPSHRPRPAVGQTSNAKGDQVIEPDQGGGQAPDAAPQENVPPEQGAPAPEENVAPPPPPTEVPPVEVQ